MFQDKGEKNSSGHRTFGGTEFPEDLPKDANGEFSVSGGEVEPVDEAADFLVGGSGGAPLLGATGTRFQVAAGAEGVEQECGEALEIGRSGGAMFLRFRRGLGITCEFIETDGYGLAKVHGAMFVASGNAQQPIAVAEVFIRKTALL